MARERHLRSPATSQEISVNNPKYHPIELLDATEESTGQRTDLHTEDARVSDLAAFRRAGVVVTAETVIASAYPVTSLDHLVTIDADSPVSSGAFVASRDRLVTDALVEEALDELRSMLANGRKVMAGDTADDILSLWCALEPSLSDEEADELRMAVIGRVAGSSSLPSSEVRSIRSAAQRFGGE
jgi:hypothetical protein